MYKFLFAIIISLLLFQDEPTLSWDYDYRLEWTDFRGKPTQQTSVVAVTASGISFSFSTKTTRTKLVDYNYVVKADFYPEKSWCLHDRVNDNVLNHERLHFDITELFARKFRKRIQSTKFTMNISKEMEALHDTINEELEEMQNAYDAETSHSQNIEKQKEWQSKIIIQLNKLSYFSS